MKTLKCDLCEATAQGETFEDWMKALMPHYMQLHADVMNNPKNGKEEQHKWMVENKARFDWANDNGLSFENLLQTLYKFRKARDWLDLDSADIAKSIVLESAELLEHYQWDNTAVKRNQNLDVKNKRDIAFEVADIFIYILEFCQQNDINLLEVAFEKLDKINIKYPAKDMRDGGLVGYKKAKIDHCKPD